MDLRAKHEFMTSSKLTLLLGALLIAGGILAVPEHRATARLREGNRVLRQDVEQLAGVSDESQRLSNLLFRASSPALPEAQMRELLRLRGEVGLLRQQTNELAKVQTQNHQLRAASNALLPRDSSQPTPDYLPRESWAFAGYADPDAALQSCLWAWSSGDPKAVVASFTPAHRAGWGFKSDEEIAKQIARNLSHARGFRILERQNISASECRLTVSDAEVRQKVGFCYKRIGSEWKFDGEFSVN
jgi:hypothetical protein